MSEDYMFTFTKDLKSQDRERLAEIVSERLGYSIIRLGFFENLWDTLSVRQGAVLDNDSREFNASVETVIVRDWR